MLGKAGVDPEDVPTIRECRDGGMTYRDLARSYRVSVKVIRAVCNDTKRRARLPQEVQDAIAEWEGMRE